MGITWLLLLFPVSTFDGVVTVGNVPAQRLADTDAPMAHSLFVSGAYYPRSVPSPLLLMC
jgi:hypothetical protein